MTKAGWNTDACEQTLLYLNAHKNVLNFFSKLIFQLTMLIWNSWTEQELHNLIQKKKQKSWVSSFVKKKPQITFPFYFSFLLYPRVHSGSTVYHHRKLKFSSGKGLQDFDQEAKKLSF